MKNSKKYLISSIILVIIAIIFTILVKVFDKGAIGPNNTIVGMQVINDYFKNMFPFNETLYKITKYAGFVPLLFGVYYAIIGLMQLIKGKSLKKVDNRIYLIGGFYILVLILYLFFEKVALNYRPVIIDGELEASFPSTHTLLAICFFISSAMVSKYYIKNDTLRKVINIFSIVFMFFIVIGRMICGCHWFTDIIGGIIISLTLLNIFYAILLFIEEKEDENGNNKKQSKKQTKN
jgi:undecaprenyl-diphosphatase